MDAELINGIRVLDASKYAEIKWDCCQNVNLGIEFEDTDKPKIYYVRGLSSIVVRLFVVGMGKAYKPVVFAPPPNNEVITALHPSYFRICRGCSNYWNILTGKKEKSNPFEPTYSPEEDCPKCMNKQFKGYAKDVLSGFKK